MALWGQAAVWEDHRGAGGWVGHLLSVRTEVLGSEPLPLTDRAEVPRRSIEEVTFLASPNLFMAPMAVEVVVMEHQRHMLRRRWLQEATTIRGHSSKATRRREGMLLWPHLHRGIGVGVPRVVGVLHRHQVRVGGVVVLRPRMLAGCRAAGGAVVRQHRGAGNHRNRGLHSGHRRGINSHRSSSHADIIEISRCESCVMREVICLHAMQRCT